MSLQHNWNYSFNLLGSLVKEFVEVVHRNQIDGSKVLWGRRASPMASDFVRRLKDYLVTNRIKSGPKDLAFDYNDWKSKYCGFWHLPFRPRRLVELSDVSMRIANHRLNSGVKKVVTFIESLPATKSTILRHRKHLKWIESCIICDRPSNCWAQMWCNSLLNARRWRSQIGRACKHDPGFARGPFALSYVTNLEEPRRGSYRIRPYDIDLSFRALWITRDIRALDWMEPVLLKQIRGPKFRGVTFAIEPFGDIAQKVVGLADRRRIFHLVICHHASPTEFDRCIATKFIYPDIPRIPEAMTRFWPPSGLRGHKLETDSVGGERAPWQPRPFDRAFALLDPCSRLQPRQLHAHARDAQGVEPWSLTSLREKLIKIGAKVISHGRYVTFQLTEGCG
jgi:hypothetical protein